MTTKRAKMVAEPATLDSLIAAGARYQPLDTGPDPAALQPESSGYGRRILGDGGISLLKGAVAVPEAAVGLADLVSGGRVGRALEQGVDIGGVNLGFRPKMAQEALDSMLTPEQKAANRAVQEAQGFVDTTIAALRNPSTILHATVESLPVMLGGGVIGRALMAGAARTSPALAARLAAADAAPLVASPGAQTAAKYAPVLAGAGGEGVATMGSQAESIRQETPDGLLTGQQSALAAGSGFITGALSVLGGTVAAKLGIHDIDTLLVGKHSPEVTKGFTRRVLEGAVSEGLLEELPQSIQEQVAQNLALGKPLGEGVPQAAVLGMFSGGLMGAGGNVSSHGGAIRAEKVEPTGPVAAAVNAGIEDTAKAADAIGAAVRVQPMAAPVEPQPAAPAAHAMAEAPPVQPPVVDPVAEPISEPPVQPMADAMAVPDDAAARAQREADRPAAPVMEPNEGEKAYRSMDAASRALATAGSGHDLVRTTKGLVVRRVDADTGELVAPGTSTPIDSAELPGVEPAPPAAPDPAHLPDDTLNPKGEPFTHRGAAAIVMRKMGKEYTIAKVAGGFAVRKLTAAVSPVDEAAHAAAPLPEPTQAQKESPADASTSSEPGPAPMASANVTAAANDKPKSLSENEFQDSNAAAQPPMAANAEPDTLHYTMAGRAWRIKLTRHADGHITWGAQVSLGGQFSRVPGDKVPLPVAKKAHRFQQQAVANQTQASIAEQVPGTDGKSLSGNGSSLPVAAENNAEPPQESSTAAPRAAAQGAHKVGDMVKLTKPGINGPVNIAGRVQAVLPDGRLDIRSQNDGIFIKAPSELGHKAQGVATPAAAPTDDAPAPKPLKRPAAAQRAAEARAAAVADYFTPGNVVKSYGGHDRVLAFSPPDENGRWSVKVQAVRKEGDAWVNADAADPRRDFTRQHSTEPEAANLKAGPVLRAPAETVAAPSDTPAAAPDSAAEPAATRTDDVTTLTDEQIKSLEGQKIDIDIAIGDTGKQASMRMDAAEAVRDVRQRLDAAQKLRKCLT